MSTETLREKFISSYEQEWRIKTQYPCKIRDRFFSWWTEEDFLDALEHLTEIVDKDIDKFQR